MFNRILVPVDGSNDGWVALEQAIEIAHEEESIIHILFVADSRIIEAPYWTAAPPDEPMPSADAGQTEVALTIGQMISDYGEKALEEARSRCEAANVDCKTEYKVGSVANVILEESDHADLLIMGRHGQGVAWAGPQFGSVFEAVARHANCPTLAAQAEVRIITRILVAYDGSERAKDALAAGVELARVQDRDLIVLVVNDGHPGMVNVFAKVKEWLDDHHVAAKTLFEEGSPTETILRVAREEDCSLIAIGAYGHGRFLEAFFGSTVDEIVHQAITPVLICH